MSIKEISFLSSNNRDSVQAWKYTPLGKPRGIIQLIHGFGEHSRRYLHMISTFNDAGFIVYADDHIGHGKTALGNNTFGDPGNTGGFMTYLQDERRLHDIAVGEHPELPYFIFGHSWGSMLARGYAANFGEDITGLMLCGICAQMEGCIIEFRKKDLAEEIKNGKGLNKDDGTWFNRVFLNMTQRIENSYSEADWITNDPDVLEDHANDPFNCMQPTLQLLSDLVDLHGYISKPEWALKIPSQLPCYLISGSEDPCGNFGEGTYHVANELVKSGNRDVMVKVYPGYRHEIHNERSIRGEVEQGLVDFINSCIAKTSKNPSKKVS